jgi:enolase-phosphatase E1
MIKAILTDIEGTTSSLSFVKDVLFPYARARMADFVRAHANDGAVRAQLDEVSRIAGKPLTDAQAIEQLIRWIDEDKKIAPLKTLQGMIWETGYRSGDFKGHVYEDAARQLQKWTAAGLRLYAFNSGSVQAQKLIFGYSERGDLTPLFAGYFDTAVGHKRETAAYRTIAQQIGLPASDVLFLSDVSEELDAARAAGMQTIQLVREGALDARAAYRQVRNFDEIQPG